MADPLNIVVATIPKTARQEIRVMFKEYRGSQFADVRIFEEFAGTCDAKSPTKSGVALSFATLPALADALAEAVTQAKALGLIGGEA